MPTRTPEARRPFTLVSVYGAGGNEGTGGTGIDMGGV